MENECERWDEPTDVRRRLSYTCSNEFFIRIFRLRPNTSARNVFSTFTVFSFTLIHTDCVLNILFRSCPNGCKIWSVRLFPVFNNSMVVACDDCIGDVCVFFFAILTVDRTIVPVD